MKVKFTDQLEGFENYPIKSSQTDTYYLHSRSFFNTGSLEKSPYQHQDEVNASNTITAWSDSIFSTQIPLLSQLLEQINIPVLTQINLSLPSHSIYYKTPLLESPMKIRGTPKVTLNISSDSPKVQLAAYLYDMNRLGTGKLITHGIITLPDVKPNEPQTFTVDFVATAYDIPIGHRLALALDTKDPLYKSPTSSNFVINIDYPDKKPSRLIIPSIH